MAATSSGACVSARVAATREQSDRQYKTQREPLTLRPSRPSVYSDHCDVLPTSVARKRVGSLLHRTQRIDTDVCHAHAHTLWRVKSRNEEARIDTIILMSVRTPKYAALIVPIDELKTGVRFLRDIESPSMLFKTLHRHVTHIGLLLYL